MDDDGNEGTVLSGPDLDDDYLVDFDGLGEEYVERAELALLP